MNDLASLVQGTDEWLQARAGSLGASQIHEALAKIQKGWGVSRTNLRRRLRAERLTGKPSATYQNQKMLDGKQREPAAREAYCWERGVDIEEIGIVVHPRLKWTHASPDGLVPPDGLVELKCPTPETHSDRLLEGWTPEGHYLLQCCWQMACTGRAWVDLCSYHPDFLPHEQLLIIRITRDDAAIAQAEELVEEFLREVEAEVVSVHERHPMRIAA